jgi:hypothetical protein
MQAKKDWGPLGGGDRDSPPYAPICPLMHMYVVHLDRM